MKFEVVNDKGVTVMTTEHASCIPECSQLSAISKSGYKFKINGKIVSLKKVKDFVSSDSNI